MPQKIQTLNEIWVAAFRIREGHRLYAGKDAEVILIGECRDQIRATVEHDIEALHSLICMCRQIAEKGNLTWRLLKFENPREVSEEEIQEWLNACACSPNLH